jgi:hypothetical protein
VLITSSNGAFGTSHTTVLALLDMAIRSGHPKKKQQQMAVAARQDNQNRWRAHYTRRKRLVSSIMR